MLSLRPLKTVCFLLCLCTSLFSEDAEIAALLKDNGAWGTMILASLDGEVTYIHNEARARQRLSPASTFKIANSLIAIEEGVLADQREIIAWDQKERWLEVWNQDQTLKSAFRTSCVWAYQVLARRVGKDRYLDYLDLLDYGNQRVGQDVTNFWLQEDALQISALEQIDFLRKICHRELPVSDRSLDILEEIMLQESHLEYKIFAKTGAATTNWQGHGWYIGYLATNTQTWLFVTNILIDGFKDLEKRRGLTLAALRKKGIIPS